MLLIPAIDLRQGQCVRLRQGRMDDYTVFSDDPLEVAQRWVDAGARRLHVVDLDGAASGQPAHAEVIGRLIAALPETVIQVGGGIRSEDTADAYLNAGVHYVVVGTRAVNDPHFLGDLCMEFQGHVIAGLDVRDGRLAVEGWSKLSNHDPLDMAQRFEQGGAEAIVYTDVTRDGMLSGVNAEATAALAGAIGIPVIASGGIRDITDIDALGKVCESGIQGAIVGRSIYEDTLDFTEGCKAAARYADVFSAS